MWYIIGLLIIFVMATFFALPPLNRFKGKVIIAILVGLGFSSGIAYFSLPEASQYLYAVRHPELKQFYYSLQNEKNLFSQRLLADQVASTLGKSELDLPAWLLLGQFYLSVDALHEAEHALSIAYHLNPMDDQLAIEYAQVSFAAHKGKFIPEIELLLRKLSESKVENQRLEMLSAMMFSQKGEHNKALALWKKLAAEVPEGTIESALINNGLKKLGSNN